MNKIYSLLMWVVMLAVCAPVAAAKTVTLTVDNPAAAYYRNANDSYNIGAWNGNTATLNVPAGQSLPIQANEGYDLVSVTSSVRGELISEPLSGYTAYEADLTDGEVLSISTQEKQAKKIKVIGDPSQVYVRGDDYRTYYADDMVDGAWYVTCTNDYGSLYINAYSDCVILSVKDSSGNEYVYSAPATSAYIYEGNLPADAVLTVESMAKADYCDSHVTVNVDGPAYMVSFRFNGQYNSITLNEGPNTVDFSSSSDLPFTISHSYNSSYNPQLLYKVAVNGTAIEPVDGQYKISTIADGGVIDIAVNPPAVSIPVSVLFADESTAAALRSLRIDGDLIDPSQYGSIQTETGKTISFDFDYNNYDITLTENGTPVTISYGSYSHKMMSETGYTYVVTATPKQPLTITVICDNWEHLIVSPNYSGDNPYTLTDIETTLSILPGDTYTYFKAPEGWYVRSVIDAETGAVYGTSFNVTDGMMIFVEVEEYKRDKHITLYTEPGVWSYLYFTLSQNNHETSYQFTPDAGYSTVAYCDADLPFGISGYDKTWNAPKVYLNGTLCENNYGSYPALADVQDGDVIKLLSNDETHAVTYDVADGLAVTVRHDLATEVDHTAAHNLHAGTEIHIIPAEVGSIVVKANGTAVEADNEGKFVHTVSEPVSFVVTANSSVGIDDVIAPAVADTDVYNLHGILILRSATPDQIEALPAGLYIIGGRKVVK